MDNPSFKDIIQKQINERRMVKQKEKAFQEEKKPIDTECVSPYTHSTKTKLVNIIHSLSLGYGGASDKTQMLVSKYRKFLDSINWEYHSDDEIYMMIESHYPTGIAFIKQLIICDRVLNHSIFENVDKSRLKSCDDVLFSRFINMIKETKIGHMDGLSKDECQVLLNLKLIHLHKKPWVKVFNSSFHLMDGKLWYVQNMCILMMLLNVPNGIDYVTYDHINEYLEKNNELQSICSIYHQNLPKHIVVAEHSFQWYRLFALNFVAEFELLNKDLVWKIMFTLIDFRIKEHPLVCICCSWKHAPSKCMYLQNNKCIKCCEYVKIHENSIIGFEECWDCMNREAIEREQERDSYYDCKLCGDDHNDKCPKQCPCKMQFPNKDLHDLESHQCIICSEAGHLEYNCSQSCECGSEYIHSVYECISQHIDYVPIHKRKVAHELFV